MAPLSHPYQPTQRPKHRTHKSLPVILAITFIAWAREQEIMVPWMRVHDARTMDLFRNRLKNTERPRIGINTFIGKALFFCDAQFDREVTGGRKVIDVSGDGGDSEGIAGLRDVL